MSTPRSQITFRLRKDDADLINAISNMDYSQVAELARDGLRLMLGITSKKAVQVIDKPISFPSQSVHRTRQEQPQETPARATIGNQGSLNPPRVFKP